MVTTILRCCVLLALGLGTVGAVYGDVHRWHARDGVQASEKSWPGRSRCMSEQLAGIVGGTLGAWVGAQMVEREGRAAAAITGTVIGYMLGAAIGRSIDRLDAACIAPVLEHARDQQTVAWTAAGQGVSYEVTPVRSFTVNDRACRDYHIVSRVEGRVHRSQDTACRHFDGRWSRVR